MPLYDLALLGQPTENEIDAVEASLSRVVAQFGLRLGAEIGWQRKAARFDPSPSTSSDFKRDCGKCRKTPIVMKAVL